MQEYSEFIVAAMKYVDKKILQINPNSIDRQRLHSKIHIQIVKNAKYFEGLKEDGVYKKIDDIFIVQLNDELKTILKG